MTAILAGASLCLGDGMGFRARATGILRTQSRGSACRGPSRGRRCSGVGQSRGVGSLARATPEADRVSGPPRPSTRNPDLLPKACGHHLLVGASPFSPHGPQSVACAGVTHAPSLQYPSHCSSDVHAPPVATESEHVVVVELQYSFGPHGNPTWQEAPASSGALQTPSPAAETGPPHEPKGPHEVWLTKSHASPGCP